jgi:hypothetical protein
MYPESLDALAALAPHRAGSEACPAARELAARILTLPARLRAEGRRASRILAALRGDDRD